MRLTKFGDLISVLVLVTCLSLTVYSQPSSPIGEGEPDDPIAVDPDPVPLGGIEFLLFSGLTYGAYSKFRRRKKN